MPQGEIWDKQQKFLPKKNCFHNDLSVKRAGIPHPSVQNKLLRDKFGKLIQKKTVRKTCVGLKKMQPW